MAKLVYDEAQIVLDDFYQSFKTESDFFDLQDAALRIVDARDAMIEDEFLVQWKINKQRGNANSSFIRVNPDWQKRITIDIKEDKERGEWYGEICEPLFEFPMDSYGNGVQEVWPYGQKCAEFIRIQDSEAWQICLTASSPIILYSVQKCRITLHNFDGACTDKLDVRIVPSQSSLPINEQVVPDGKSDEIREMVISKMWRNYSARLGKIDMSNNGNPNVEPDNSGMVYDNLKTK